ncbi:carboxypeptidase-like protein [Chitinophaga skermanii]|uniref:Carboxypeptidase-like protein n=1 Tax=Chitinophaga skermanii TaxID=331697 RepID=A0A327QJ59_9BACT|nr:carboxypeptidase-like regulatory domain-containing protein [Chitinophaga skermanii]RAJ04018.1 carboxypeptidase-like protein [Chitinophaga skermanii]
MKQNLSKYTVALLLFTVLGFVRAQAQLVRTSGMVSDADTHTGLPGVSIWNKTSRQGTVSNETGRYFLEAMPGDTIEFTMVSYVRSTIVIPAISSTMNVELKKQIFGLPQVTIRGSIYKQDSLANRQEYGRYFGYKRPGAVDVLKTLPFNPVTALSYLVPSKARKRKEMFGKSLEYWEKEHYIDYRFNEEMIARITKLEGDDLEKFMNQYRPSYSFLQTASEYDFLLYIKQSYERFIANGKGGITMPKDTIPGNNK